MGTAPSGVFYPSGPTLCLFVLVVQRDAAVGGDDIQLKLSIAALGFHLLAILLTASEIPLASSHIDATIAGPGI